MNVRQFKDFLLKVTDSGDDVIQFRTRWVGSNPVRLRFFHHLNELGARNMATHPPDKYPDIDATVDLSPAEELDLFLQFQHANSAKAGEATGEEWQPS